MPAPVKPNTIPQPDIQIPLPKVVQFLRQLIHDLRNHLNASELQSAYIAEIAESPELKEEVKRLRAMISDLGANLHNLNAALSQPKLTTMSYSATDFLADLRQKWTTDHPDEGAKMQWTVQVGNASLQIDPQVLIPALTELFTNAFKHGRGEGLISVDAQIEDDHLVLTLREPKVKFECLTDNWGREPLHSIGKGHYGLGLHRSLAIIEAHRGQLNARYDSTASSLITTVVLPLDTQAG